MIDKFIIGIIGAPFGLKGFVKVRSTSGEIDHLLQLKSVLISKDGVERNFTVEETAPAPPAVLMRFSGINSPEEAKALTGAQLISGREGASPLAEGEFYIEDLKGLSVRTEDGEVIGKIADIIEGGGGELAEITLVNGETKLVPFRKEFFSDISPENAELTLINLWILE
jgi:16S rRNA processing protein RimM